MLFAHTHTHTQTQTQTLTKTQTHTNTHTHTTPRHTLHERSPGLFGQLVLALVFCRLRRRVFHGVIALQVRGRKLLVYEALRY